MESSSQSPPSLPSSPSPSAEPAISGILARAERAVSRAGERLLVERLHRVLDEEGSAALTSLSETLLPLLQALIIVLPRAVLDGASPAVLAAAQTLGAALQERNAALPDLLTEGLQVHDRLLQEVATDLRASDLALVRAMLQVSHVLLEVERAVLLAYQEGADAALVRAALSDPTTGLATWTYFQERLADALRLARRRERPLVLLLIGVDAGQAVASTTAGPGGLNDRPPRLFSALLRAQMRSTDLAAHRRGNLFALLPLETDQDGALALLERLRRVAAAQDTPLHLSAGIAVSPEQGLSADELLEQAEQALARAPGHTTGGAIHAHNSGE